MKSQIFQKAKKFESKHNYGYWEHKEYLGVGAGAVGYKQNSRYYPKKDIQEYINEPIKYEIENLKQKRYKNRKSFIRF